MNDEKEKSIIEISLKPPVKIENFNDIVYKKILEDYKYHFCDSTVTIETNYKLLKSFDIYFEPKQLPHLMGWDKITNKKIGAARINELIDTEKFNVESTRRHHNFKSSRKRMLNYNFLHEIFTYRSHDICIMTSDMKPNSMRLDIVFYKENEKEATILGLRRDYKMGYSVPTTLHNKSLDNQFSKRRRTFIKSVKWDAELEVINTKF